MDRAKSGMEMNATRGGESPYLPDYVGPERYEGYDSGEQVINHLMFYKSIISEEDSGQKISEYMNLVESLKEGEHLPIKDPFDKSIALTFELVIQNHLNPWDVDLLKFSTLYMDRMKHEQDVDFITAGRLMFMAWSVLKLQSDEVLASSQYRPEEQAADAGWDPGMNGEWMQTDAGVDYTTAVLNRPEPPLQESVYRKGTRPVTLFELVGAFEEARKEAELQKVLAEERKRQRLLWEGQKALKVDAMMHREDLQEDINNIWCRIKPLSGRITLSQLCTNGADEERLTAFVSVLFLAFVNQVHLWQENFPYGEIFLEKAAESELNLDKLQNITHPQRKEIWDVKKGRKKGKRAGKKRDAEKVEGAPKKKDAGKDERKEDGEAAGKGDGKARKKAARNRKLDGEGASAGAKPGQAAGNGPDRHPGAPERTHSSPPPSPYASMPGQPAGDAQAVPPPRQ